MPLKIHSGDNQFSKFFDELLKDRISADTEISAAVSEIIKEAVADLDVIYFERIGKAQ